MCPNFWLTTPTVYISCTNCYCIHHLHKALILFWVTLISDQFNTFIFPPPPPQALSSPEEKYPIFTFVEGQAQDYGLVGHSSSYPHYDTSPTPGPAHMLPQGKLSRSNNIGSSDDFVFLWVLVCVPEERNVSKQGKTDLEFWDGFHFPVFIELKVDICFLLYHKLWHLCPSYSRRGFNWISLSACLCLGRNRS